MTMTEYEILKKRIEEWNRGKGAEFQLQLGEAEEDYVDPDSATVSGEEEFYADFARVWYQKEEEDDYDYVFVHGRRD